MLFVFEKKDTYRIWTKDMQFPIDIFWISERGIVEHIEKDKAPCVLPMCELLEPPAKIKYILETNAGFAEEQNIFYGSKLSFHNLK